MCKLDGQLSQVHSVSFSRQSMSVCLGTVDRKSQPAAREGGERGAMSRATLRCCDEVILVHSSEGRFICRVLSIFGMYLMCQEIIEDDALIPQVCDRS